MVSLTTFFTHFFSLLSEYVPLSFHSTVVTATLIEDATNAELIGGQRVMTIGGQATSVYAAASCGFADGLKKDQKTKAAGYCVYWNVVDHATTTWTSVA